MPDLRTVLERRERAERLKRALSYFEGFDARMLFGPQADEFCSEAMGWEYDQGHITNDADFLMYAALGIHLVLIGEDLCDEQHAE